MSRAATPNTGRASKHILAVNTQTRQLDHDAVTRGSDGHFTTLMRLGVTGTALREFDFAVDRPDEDQRARCVERV